MKITRIILCVFALASVAFAQTAGVESPQGHLLWVSDGSFYGTCASGGVQNYGALFRVTPESEVSVVINLTGDDGAAKGAYPHAGLVDDGSGVLWGTTSQGGTSGLGTVFKFDPATSTFTTVINFAGTNGSYPEAALVSDGAGLLWGTTRTGGTGDFGTVFTVNVATGALTTIAEFTGTAGAKPGSQPKAALVRDGSGVWWGTTSAGGTGELGTIFSIDPANSNAFTSELTFTGTNGAALGSAPVAPLIIDANGKLWGTTSTGGTSDKGSVFRFNPTNHMLTTLVNFTGANGSYPKAALRLDGALMWGTTFAGGTADLGTVFHIATADDAFTLTSSFTGTTGTVRGAYPVAALVPGIAGELWGVASKGGLDDRGTIFKVLTATGSVQLVAEPEFAPVVPTATAQVPPGTATTGPAGAPITLRGTAKDNIQLLSVIVSINGGPFLPATVFAPLLPGKPYAWQLDVIPENGVNVVIVKSVDNGGNPAKPIKLVFNYTVVRLEVAGSYTGLLTPTASSTTPLQHTGVFRLKVTPKGRFTGKLTLGGRPLPVVLAGSIGNSGAARFGKTGTTQLLITRPNASPLLLSLNLDVDAPYSRQITGTLRESAVNVATATGGQMIYTAKPNPLAPLQPVPQSLLDPATDKGAYTAVFRALTPAAQGLAASDFPQGDGYALMTIMPTGAVKLVGKLADGSSFTASNALTADNTLPFFVKLYTGAGAVSGTISFRDLAAQSDADCTGMLWFRPANAKAPTYRAGWIGGIEVDFAASRFVAPAGGSTTALGNAASSGSANALVGLSDGNLPGELNNLLAIPAGGVATVLGAPLGGTAATGLTLSLLKSGAITGSFVHPAKALPTAFGGVVLQKSQTGSGFFLAAPVGGLTTDPKQSGHLDLSAQ